jgi:hypothetical protein
MWDAIRWILCILFAIPVVFMLPNWMLFVSKAWEATRTGQSRPFSFALPFIPGVAGVLAVLLCPTPGAGKWAWLPLVLDASIFFFVLAIFLHVIARVIGRPSPFDPRKNHEENAPTD